MHKPFFTSQAEARVNLIKPDIYMLQNLREDTVTGMVTWLWRSGGGAGPHYVVLGCPGSHHAAQAGLKLIATLLPQPLTGWD